MPPRKQVVRSSIDLKYFDMSNIRPDSTIAIIAPRRSGKSVLVKDILYRLRDQFAYGIIVSTTEELNRFYQDFVPDTFIYHEYDPQRIAKIIERQKQIIKTHGKKPENRMFCVFDDVLADASLWMNDPTVKDIFFNGRHFNMFFILSIQYAMSLKASFRSNLDYTFVFYDKATTNQEKIYKNFAVGFESFQEFKQVFDKVGKLEHISLVFSPEGLHHYKASLDHGSFLLGSPRFWEYHQHKYDKKYYLKGDKQMVVTKGKSMRF